MIEPIRILYCKKDLRMKTRRSIKLHESEFWTSGITEFVTIWKSCTIDSLMASFTVKANMRGETRCNCWGQVQELKPCDDWNHFRVENMSNGWNQVWWQKPILQMQTKCDDWKMLRSSQGWIRGWIQVIWLIPCVLVGSWCDGWNQAMVETIGYRLTVAYVHNTWFFNLNQLW